MTFYCFFFDCPESIPELLNESFEEPSKTTSETNTTAMDETNNSIFTLTRRNEERD
jgi:hypothetical protein